jgi:hypothetical protein
MWGEEARMSDFYKPEVGQFCFGNKWGSHDAGDLGEACVQHLLAEIERVFWNVHQRQWDRCEDPKIPGVVFHPYYWGDCECGCDEADAEWEQANPHTPSCYQTDYAKIREMPGSPVGPKRDAAAKALCEKHGIPWNGGRGSAVHCTCGRDELWLAWRSEHDHQKTCGVVVPNLVIESRPTVVIRWYKHARRGLTTDTKVSPDQWRDWLNAACAVVRGADRDLYAQ